MGNDGFEQMSLLGDAPVAKPALNRLFFALMPDEQDAARLFQLGAELRMAHGLRGRPIGENRLHITLHHLGDFPEVPELMVNRARQAGETLVHLSFALSFDSVMSFGKHSSNPPFVLVGSEENLSGVISLQREVGVRMAHAGLSREVEKRFTPHMTLAYDLKTVPQQPIEPVSWQAKELVLVHSLIGQSVYFVLGRWPLKPVA